MKITYLENDKIIFNNMNGTLMNHNKNYIEFVNKVCNIDHTNYDSIYSLDDGWAGTLLLVKGNKYRKIQCGSGRPLITESEENGILEK